MKNKELNSQNMKSLDDFLLSLPDADPRKETLKPFRPEVGDIVQLKNSVYKVIASRSNGKVTLKFCGVVK